MALLRVLLALWVMATACGVCGTGWAQDASGEPPLEVSASLDRRTVAVGDTFRLHLDLSWRDGIEVKPIAVGDKIGAFTVRDLSYGLATAGNGRFSRRVSLLLTVFETGEQTVPSLSVVYSDAAGLHGTVASQPLEMEVVSVLPADAAEIRDIKAPISVPRRWKDLILSYALLVGLVAGAATSVLLSVMRREQIEVFFRKIWVKATGPLRRFFLWLLMRIGLIARSEETRFDVRVTEPDLNPEETALREIDRIQALGLLDRQMVKEHYTLLSETVRRYLERKYAVLAMESPTSLTLVALEDRDVAPDGMRLIAEVLGEGDMVKFAKFVPGRESIESFADRSREIVRLTGCQPVVLQVEG
jgi:hypothetical protein